MNLNPLAEELNQEIRQEAPHVFDMLSNRKKLVVLLNFPNNPTGYSRHLTS